MPFDSLTLAAVTAELQTLVGGKIQKISQPDDTTIVLSVYRESKERHLLLSAHAVYARAHLVELRPPSPPSPPGFCQTLRKHLADARLVFVRQRGLDRVLDLAFTSPLGDYQLVAEIMGKHSNVFLVDQKRTILAAAKWVKPSQSKRPIRPNTPYLPPPFEPRPHLLEAPPDAAPQDIKPYEGASPFLLRLLAAGLSFAEVQEALQTQTFHPSESPRLGPYPFDLSPLDPAARPQPSLSLALERHYRHTQLQDQLATAKSSLAHQLERVLIARQVALAGVEEAIATAHDAPALQEKGQLLLAYQHQIKPGDKALEAWGYDGQPLQIPLKPDLTPVENANRLFHRARHAKDRLQQVQGQAARLAADAHDLRRALSDLDHAESLPEIAAVRTTAENRKWLHHQHQGKTKEERPYEGHPVRELLSPRGHRVLYGTTSTSNDYLTTKVAKGNDLWFHVRGQPSAHVVLLTAGHPEKVQPEDLAFAAAVAARNSPAKHSNHVPVDYTLKKYVRKPRGSAPGYATYEREKTIHVDP